MWTRETEYCKEVCRYENKNGRNKVGYEAKVIIKVVGENGTVTTRTGIGHGSGIANDLFDAIEGAAKEAETDAMKRALMTFGNQFGLALYDKEQKNVVDAEQHEADKKGVKKFCTNKLESFKSLQEIKDFEEKFVGTSTEERMKKISPEDYEKFFDEMKALKEQFKQQEA